MIWDEFKKEFWTNKVHIMFLLIAFNILSFPIAIFKIKGWLIPVIGFLFSLFCCHLAQKSHHLAKKYHIATWGILWGPVLSSICYIGGFATYFYYQYYLIYKVKKYSINNQAINWLVFITFIFIFTLLISSYIEFIQPLDKLSKNKKSIYELITLMFILDISDFNTALLFISGFLIFSEFILSDDFFEGALGINLNKNKKKRKKKKFRKKLLNSRLNVANFNVALLFSEGLINLFFDFQGNNIESYNLLLAMFHFSKKKVLIDVFQKNVLLLLGTFVVFCIAFIVLFRIESSITKNEIEQNLR